MKTEPDLRYFTLCKCVLYRNSNAREQTGHFQKLGKRLRPYKIGGFYLLDSLYSFIALSGGNGSEKSEGGGEFCTYQFAKLTK